MEEEPKVNSPQLLQEVLAILHDIMVQKGLPLDEDIRHRIVKWRDQAENHLSEKGFF